VSSIANSSEELQAYQMKSLRAFRDRFPTSMRSHVTNLFLDAVRAGAATPEVVVVAVAATAIARLQRAQRRQDAADVTKFSLLDQLLVAHAEEACHFAAGCIAWEALPWKEKAARKATREQAYRRRHMAGLVATPKQRNYLQALGYLGPIESRLHASRLIDALRQGGQHHAG
jgi:hypothetical protein